MCTLHCVNFTLPSYIFFQSTVDKKKMYYKMKTKTLERRYTEIVKQLEEEKDNLSAIPSKKLMKLTYVLKEVSCQTQLASCLLDMYLSLNGQSVGDNSA